MIIIVRSFGAAALVIVLASGLTTCRSRQLRTPESSAMIVLPNARDVKKADIYDGQITYMLEVPYPGEASIHEIRRRLTTMGWRPRDRDLLNPSLSYAITARWRRVASGKRDVLGWTEQWQNAGGEVVAYSFSYDVAVSGGNPEPGTPMAVSASYFRASTVAAFEREKRNEQDRR